MSNVQNAVFAGGCFWCMQADFDKINGVIKTTAGYIGGTQPNPTYAFVSSGRSNYVEAIKVIYDPNKITYNRLLYYFWHNVDPTRDDGQFCDAGRQYAPRIFYVN
ncbi:MAG: peptide-methionine (S)-S-oxide reductase, partial [Methylophilaceae bacterium]